jgi:triacylglycerol lipase
MRMSMTFYDAPPGDARNALLLARACELAYYKEPEGPQLFRSELGLDARLIEAGNTEVYLAQSDQAVVVAFRGSESPATLDGFKDWLVTNANNYLIVPEGRAGTDFAAAGVGARFHRGFLEALDLVWQPLYAAADEALKAKERPLRVTGHSLGGALALLAAWRLKRNFLSVHEVVTFGAPMVGNEAASKAFEREFAGEIFRYVDIEDLVPLLPSVSLVANAYCHCQAEVALSPTAAPQAEAQRMQSLRAPGDTDAEGTLDPAQVEQVWDMVKDRIASHMIASYQARVQTRIKEMT